MLSVDTELGPIGVDFSEPLMTLCRNLRRAESPDAASSALRQADHELDTWETSRRGVDIEHSRMVLPFGVEVRFPRDFEPRR